MSQVVVKCVSNATFFGDVSVLRMTAQKLVSASLGLTEEILFIHRHDNDAPTGIQLHILAASDNETARLLETALIDVLGIPKLTCKVSFDESASTPDVSKAISQNVWQAKTQLDVYFDTVRQTVIRNSEAASLPQPAFEDARDILDDPLIRIILGA